MPLHESLYAADRAFRESSTSAGTDLLESNRICVHDVNGEPKWLFLGYHLLKIQGLKIIDSIKAGGEEGI